MAISRLARIESRKNRRSALVILTITVLIVVGMLRYGFTILPKFTDFLRDLGGQNVVTQNEDETAPPAPNIDELPEYTKEKKLVVTGSSEQGSMVVVKMNNNEKEVIVNADNQFTATFELKDGENTVSATSRDRAGNKSDSTSTYKVIYDTKAPDLTIDKPVSGESFFGTLGRQKSIEGKTEEDATVRINDRVVVVSRSGSFVFSVSLSEGENLFKVVARDLAGNETTQEIKINYTR